MNYEDKNTLVAIIGCGPRGLSALESLFSEAAKKNKKVNVLVFEESDYPGAGPVYDLNQLDSNWLNVCERAIDIPHREKITGKSFDIPMFPDYQDWCGYTDKSVKETDPDKFPLRSHLGAYLNERFKSIASILQKENVMEYVHGKVINVDFSNELLKIEVLGGTVYQANEVIMSIGHQPIEFDDQLSGWKNRISNLDTSALFTQPYPLSRLIDSEVVNINSAIAIRGFGLAMIDTVRALSTGIGGTFEILDQKTREMSYIKSGNEPKIIVPFSLDGLPMAPKPLHKVIDDKYVPTQEELDKYSNSIKSSVSSKTPASSTEFLMMAIAPIIVKKYQELGDDTMGQFLSKEESHDVVIKWLKDEKFEHKFIVPKTLNTADMMEKYIAMATGHGEVSLDFCIGHVWRHCQPTMYKLLSFIPLSDEVIKELVALDERLKRYSYGPPVDSLQQVLALVQANILTLDFVNNPNIELNEYGWKLENNTNSLVIDVMINSVLDAPQILKVISPLPKKLIKKSSVEPLHDSLGIRTNRDGTIEKSAVDQLIPMAVLGRLAKGTLIGVDAIAECFGLRSKYWAEGVMARID